jgi:polyisoprenoid-binding protein YceI
MSTVVTTSIPAGTWTLDKVHSTAGFEVGHMVVSTFRGRFHELDARLEDGRLTGTVRPESVDVNEENLAAHLRSPEFFDVETYPEIRFESTSIDVADDGAVRLEGDFTIKGITKPVTATGRLVTVEADMTGGRRIGITLDATIDRTEFGLNWNAPLPKGGFALDNDVRLIVALELTPEA